MTGIIKRASVPRLFLTVLGIALALCLFSSGSSAVASTPKETVVSHFFPSGVRASLTSTADCWETSLAAPRKDAWRCTVVNTIYDPCFSSDSYPHAVICDANPATDTRGLKVTLSEALPATTADATEQPWVLQLSNGAYCTFATGATGMVDNERIDYGCTNNTLIAGLPKQGTIWTANVVLQGQTTHPVATTVIHAWF